MAEKDEVRDKGKKLGLQINYMNYVKKESKKAEMVIWAKRVEIKIEGQ